MTQKEADYLAHIFINDFNVMISPNGPYVIINGCSHYFNSVSDYDCWIMKKYMEKYNTSVPTRVLSRINSLTLMPYDFDTHSYAFYRKSVLDTDLEKVDDLKEAYNNYLESDALNYDKVRKKKSIHISGNGGCGKSTLAKILALYVYKYPEDEIFKCATGNNSFDEYTGQKVIIFDEFRGNIAFRDFLDLTDPNANVKVGARYHNKSLQRTELIIFNSTRKVNELYSTEVTSEDPVQLYRRLEWYENDNQFMIFKRHLYDPKTKNYELIPKICNFSKLYDRYLKEHPRDTFSEEDFSDVDVNEEELPF